MNEQPRRGEMFVGLAFYKHNAPTELGMNEQPHRGEMFVETNPYLTISSVGATRPMNMALLRS